MLFNDHRAWTDLGPSSKLKPPNVVITAAELALMSTNQVTSDLYLMGNESRKVVYNDAVLGKIYMELILYVQPVGVTFTTLAVATSEGRFIGWDGAFNAAADTADAVAGMMIGPYYSGTNDNPNVSYIVGTLVPGDAIWVCRRGNVPLDYSGTSTAGRLIKCANSGEVQNCAAPSAGYNNDNDIAGTLHGLAVGSVQVASAGAGLKAAILNLPLRFRRGT